MSEYNIISKSVWNSKKFKSLKKDQFSKLVYLYLLNCRHSNSCGCYFIHPGYIADDLNCTESEVKKSMENLSAVDLIEYDTDENTVFIKNFLIHNPPRNPKHAIKVFNDTMMIPSRAMRSACISQLSAILREKNWKLPKDKQELIESLSYTLSIGMPDLATPIPIPILNSTHTHKDLYASHGLAQVSPIEYSDISPDEKIDALAENLNGQMPDSFLMPDGTFKNFDGLYELLWAKYPSLRNKGHRDKAKMELRKILKKGVEYGKIIEAVTRYSDYCHRTGEFNPDFFRWLKNRGYEIDYQAGEVSAEQHGRPNKNRGYDPNEAFSIALSDPKGRNAGTEE